MSAVLRAPCPACGIVDRVVKASPDGGYRMIRHTAPQQRYQFRAMTCRGKALISVFAIRAQAKMDRASAESSITTEALLREDLRASHERAIAESTTREAARRADVAAIDKALAKLVKS